MKKKIYLWLTMFLLLFATPAVVMAWGGADDYEETEASELYSLELNESWLQLARPGKTARLYVESYYEDAYPFSGVVWSSDDPSVAAVSGSGKVTAVGRGNCVITATAKDDSSITASCYVEVEKYAVTYCYQYGNKKVTKYYDGEDELTLASPKRAGYIFDGWYRDKKYSKKIKKIPEDNVKNYTLYAKWSKVKKPGKPSIRLSSSAAGKLKVTLKKKVGKADGYQILLAKNKSFSSGKKIVQMTGSSKTLSGLTAGAKYFVKVRAYTADSTGGKHYGSYSAVSSVVVKKAVKKVVKKSTGGTVYITRTGSKYHRGSCRYLRQSKIAISRSDAIAQGYTACKVCKP